MVQYSKAFKTDLSKSIGFTLIEVMIVVVIVAILAAIALPSYQQHVQKSRRVDAKETLMRMATLQERHFFQESTYSATLAGMGGDTSPEGWYKIDPSIGALACAAEPCNTFTITATADGPQLKDETCRTFSIDQTLQTESKDVSGAVTTDQCW